MLPRQLVDHPQVNFLENDIGCVEFVNQIFGPFSRVRSFEKIRIFVLRTPSVFPPKKNSQATQTLVKLLS